MVKLFFTKNKSHNIYYYYIIIFIIIFNSCWLFPCTYNMSIPTNNVNKIMIHAGIPILNITLNYSKYTMKMSS